VNELFTELCTKKTYDISIPTVITKMQLINSMS